MVGRGRRSARAETEEAKQKANDRDESACVLKEIKVYRVPQSQGICNEVLRFNYNINKAYILIY
jgi:hypothetical protein